MFIPDPPHDEDPREHFDPEEEWLPDPYELDDPKHPTFYERMADYADLLRKREREDR